MILVLVLLLAPERLEPRLEVGPPSYCFPVYFQRSVAKPPPIFGYMWVEHDYGMQSKYGFLDPGWALYRTTLSPADDAALFKRLNVPREKLWRLGR